MFESVTLVYKLYFYINIEIVMENNTLLLVFVDCMPMTNEYEPLWITVMVVISAISTITAMILKKYCSRAFRVCAGTPTLPCFIWERGRRRWWKWYK